MNVDAILRALNSEKVEYLLIGGMNFLLRHVPELTFDVDIWVKDTTDNLESLHRALRNLGAAWGPTELEWRAVPEDWHWLRSQQVFCLTSEYGAVDIFRDVLGLENQFDECRSRSYSGNTASGVAFRGLADEDMLTCQTSLPPEQQKQQRMEILRKAIGKKQ